MSNGAVHIERQRTLGAGSSTSQAVSDVSEDSSSIGSVFTYQSVIPSSIVTEVGGVLSGESATSNGHSVIG